MAFQRYGTRGIGALYDRLCDVTMGCTTCSLQHASFEVLHRPECNILCFRWVGDRTASDEALDGFNRELRERYNRSGAGWITATNLGGRRVLRVTVMNPRTGERDVAAIVEGLAAEAGRMAAEGTGR